MITWQKAREAQQKLKEKVPEEERKARRERGATRARRRRLTEVFEEDGNPPEGS